MSYIVFKNLDNNLWGVQIFDDDAIVYEMLDAPSQIEAKAFAMGFIRGAKLFQEAMDFGHNT